MIVDCPCKALGAMDHHTLCSIAMEPGLALTL